MLKKLRLKIILAIVLVAAVMLCAILGLFYTLTKQNLRTQSISMMQAIAADENYLHQVVGDGAAAARRSADHAGADIWVFRVHLADVTRVFVVVDDLFAVSHDS